MNKCKLLSQETFEQAKFNFEEIKALPTGGGPGADHYGRYLVRCIDCGQYYIKEVVEWWSSDGDDSYSINYIPVLENEIDEVNKLDYIEILHKDIYITSGTNVPWRLIENKAQKQFYTQKIQNAISFATKVHAEQTRKGKPDFPYITHPLSVSLILMNANASEDVIIAGILHDTIEDCKPYRSVNKELLEKEFGKDVAEMVNNVTEQDKSLPWAERKQKALEHIKDMDHNAILVKSADVLHNMRDQLADYLKEGDAMFERFNASKELQLERYRKLVTALHDAWDANPLLPEIKQAFEEINRLWNQKTLFNK